MKTKLFVTAFICCLCAASICWAQEKVTLPLPDPGNVTLSLDEYNKLVELAAKPPRHTDIAPLPFSIKHCDVNLHVDNDAVRGNVQLEGEVFRKGVSKV